MPRRRRCGVAQSSSSELATQARPSQPHSRLMVPCMWAVVWLIAAHLHILGRRLEAVAALRVEAVVQAAEGVVHLRLEHLLMAEY